MTFKNYNEHDENSIAVDRTAPRVQIDNNPHKAFDELPGKGIGKQEQSLILLVHQRYVSKAVDPQGITHIVCIGKKLKIYTDICPIQISARLKDYEDKLKTAGFFRANHNILVNLHYVESISKRNKTITLKDGLTLPVSKRKWSNLWSAMDKFLK